MQHKSTFFILLILPFFLISSETDPVNDSKRMNILFIAVDDLKPMLNAYGESQIISPNIDRLASEGTVFLNNHCQQAVCGPSRASLMTGLRPDKTKVWDLKTRMRDINPDILAMPQYFRQHGYTTAAFGKIYDPRCVDKDYDGVSWSVPYVNTSEFPLPPGIEEPMFSHYQDPETRKKGAELIKEAEKKGLKGWDTKAYGLEQLKPVVECADVPDNAYYDGMMVDHAIAMLKKMAAEDVPFFLGVGFKKPHLPFVSPKRYWDMYDRSEISIAAFQEKSLNGPEIAYHNNGEMHTYTGITWTDDRIPEDEQKEIIHGYYAAVSYIDAQIGKLIENLESLGLKENTVIVLWGDHGWHLGDHALWAKHSNFEQATRAPLIFSVPGLVNGNSTVSPTEFLDIFPTLCELTGLEIPSNLDGISLVPVLDGSATSVKDYAMSQYPRGRDVMGYSIRNERYRYTEWHGNAYRSFNAYDATNIVGTELYDYEKDPLETVNLAGDEAYREIRETLADALKKKLMQ